MTKEELFSIMRARPFFSKYCPQVKRFYHKMNGVDGNKKPIDFSPEDKLAIKAGIKQLREDLKRLKM